MTQAAWPEFRATTFEPRPPLREFDPFPARGASPSVPAPSGDAVRRPWWNGAAPRAMLDSPLAQTGSAGAFGFVQSILGALSQLVSALFAAAGGDRAHESGPQRAFADADLASIGDPHLAASGTAPDGTRFSAYADSMTSHDDLFDARDIPGGYRVSTAVTTPGARGVTWNQSATVHADGDADRITMANDGTIAIEDLGLDVSIAKGQSLTLAGGEMVTDNADGSLVVTATDADGGSIATTLRANGSGVDVTAHAHDLALGGDILDPAVA